LSAFRSLKGRNYRIWAAGALVSNIGAWMQRTAQDWIVLAELTHRDARAMGVVMALQFAPQLLLLPVTGWAADHLDRRRLLLATQASMGLLALILGVLVVSHQVRLWQVNLLALLLGCVAAFDAPTRQTFVSELVARDDLPNAVALNSTSFNAARMVGPAVAGALIAAIGSGWVFLLNAASFLAVIASLLLLRPETLIRDDRPRPGRGALIDGFAYVWGRPDLKALLVMLFLVGTFGMNYPIFISTMSVNVFHAGASQFGLLTSTMALGSVAGALLAAQRGKPNLALLQGAAAAYSAGFAVAAVMPNYWLFGAALIVIGLAAQTFTTSINAMVQLSTEPAMRGRVMAILLAVAVGGTPIGAPFVGWVAHTLGPRWALGVGALAGLSAALVGWRASIKSARSAERLDERT
jgi:MFS family permease